VLASWLMPGCRKSQGTRPTKSSHGVPRKARRAAGAAPVLFLSASSCAQAWRPQQEVHARRQGPKPYAAQRNGCLRCVALR